MSIRRLFSFIAAVALACGGASGTQTEAVSLPQQHAGPGMSGESGAIPQPIGRDERDAAVPILGIDPIWGDRRALVTIVEFADFQCPFCARSAETIAQLQKDYGPRTLRVVYKHSPLSFHVEAKPAAEAAETVRALAGNAAFWSFYDLAFHNQGDLGMPSYESWARQSGVSLAAFREAMQAHRFAAKVDEDTELGKRLGVNGTPAFFINGAMLTGAQPIDMFKSLVDAQITASKERLAKGVAADDLYTAASKENFKKAETTSDDDADKAAAKIVWKVPVGTSPQLGAKTALVTIVEFSDFQCPYCKRVQPALQQIKTTYGADVRFVFKQMPLPFHPRAEPSAELALEARAEKGDAGFWAAHDKLFDSNPKLDDGDLEQVATDLKLDVAKVKAAIASKKYQRTIDQDQELGDDVQASGTPHFFINGHRLVGAQPFEKFKGRIDEELTKARALVAAGTKPENVYDEVTKTGQVPPPPMQKAITLTGSAPTRGPASARVTIVELSDFQCPYCKRAEDTIADVLKAYPTQVKVQWRHMPLKSIHPRAELAAEASVEAFKQKGNDAFWKLHDALYGHQSDPDGLERPQIEGYAHTIGLDMTKLRAALDSGSDASVVDADSKSGENAGVYGTPAFFIGSGTPSGAWTAYYLSGAQPLSKFKKLIDLSLGTHP